MPNMIQNVANLSSIDNTEQDVKQKLIAKILENMVGQRQSASSPEDISTIVKTAKEKIKEIIGDDDKNPVYAQILSSLDNFVPSASNTSTVEISDEKTAISGRSMARKMKARLSANSEMKAPSNGSANGLGSGAPLKNDNDSSLPTPPLPPSGCPDYDDLSSSDINNWILHSTDDQIESALMKYYEYLTGPGKTDPTALMKLMNFIAFLSSHKRPDGSPLIDQRVSDFIDKNCNLTGSDGTNGGIALWVRQMADYAYAAGYAGKTGAAARDQWIQDEEAAWDKIPGNKWKDCVEKCLHTSSITTDPHLGQTADGRITYTYDGFTYYWDNTGKDGCPFSDRDIIMSIFNGHTQVNDDGTITPDPFWNNTDSVNMERAYRVSVLNSLLKEFKDPIWAVMLFFEQSTDSQFQAHMSAHARESDDITDWQVYATTLNEEIQKFQNGTATAQDAHNFARALYGAKVFADQHPDLLGLNSSFKTNVFDMIGNITDGTAWNPSIKELITNIDAGDDTALAKDLNAIFKSSPPTPPPQNANDPAPPAPTNTNAQIAINAANTFSSMATGMSKNEVTIQGQDASIETAFNTFGGDITQLNAQLGKTFCGNQKTA